jgi:Domain of unknown function (DUF4124)
MDDPTLAIGGCLTRRRVDGRGWVLVYTCLAWLCLGQTGARAQQIYRWTDASGQVHFGNQPPPGSKHLEAKDRARTEFEIACDAVVREKCQDYVDKYGKWQSSEAYRDCVERNRETCARLQPHVQPTPARERFISTPALPFDPLQGESLLCEMRCPDRCRGQVEIRSDRVLKKGENYGIDRYTMEVKPQQAGSAFCSVTTPNDDVQLVLSVMRDGSATAVVEGQ